MPDDIFEYEESATASAAPSLSSTPPNSDGDISEDLLVRYIGGQLASSFATEDFVDAFRQKLLQIQSVASEAISALKDQLDYSGHYTAFLLNQISEMDFQRIAEQYLVSINPIEANMLKQKLKLFFVLTNRRFTPSELSSMFKADELLTERVLQDLKDSNFLEADS